VASAYAPGKLDAIPSALVVEMIEKHRTEIGMNQPRKISDDEMDYLTGYGFALHRGGPMCYADTVGLFNVVQAVKRFARNPHDDAAFWQPAPLLAKLAAEGKSFS
jgi:3-hydroxyacyl-CoA dehydrogenase